MNTISQFLKKSVPHISPYLPTCSFSDGISQLSNRSAGYKTPIVADIHFTPKVALVCADFVDKAETTPGKQHSRSELQGSERT